MPITFRNYSPEPLFTPDYLAVRRFLRGLNARRLRYPGFLWSRWEWMTTHSMLDRAALGRIGLWEEGGALVALSTCELWLGDAYLFVAEGAEHLLPELLRHAKEQLRGPEGIRVLVDNNDRALQRAAREAGFVATRERECTALLALDGPLDYRLPAGFSIRSMSEGWDYAKYHEVMWRGFDHEGPPPQTARALEERHEMLSSPTIDPELVLAVVAPDGRYVSHCGMWHAPGDPYALVEPVATDPAFRLMGLGRAAVLEACARCRARGAEVALVGSSQQFYYNIGFAPIHTGTWWSEARRG